MTTQAENTRILIVEDSKTQAELLCLTLQEAGMATHCVATLANFIELVKNEQFSAIMLDLTLPDSYGLSTLLKAAIYVPSSPIIVLTGLEDESVGLEALKNGAEDFLIKGVTPPSMLIRAVRYAIERKQQARALRQMQRHTREIIERAHDAFLAIDLDGVVVDWNHQAQRLFGWSRLEAIGERLADLITEGDHSLLLSNSLDNFKSNISDTLITDRLEINGHNRRGETLPIELAFFPVQSEDTHILCSFVSDLTKRKEVEQRMNEFYSIVSHELRSPVTSIRGSLRLLEGGVVGDLGEQALDLIHISIESCERMIRLISDLLDVSKIEAGALELNLNEVGPEILINSVIEGLQGMASEARIKLSKQILATNNVRGDKDKMLQVLTNLVSNAVKFSPENSEITLNVESRSAGTIRFSVTDQGPGIPKKDLHRIFGKFQQLSNTQTVGAKGTGLGLAISKAIVTQHGGDIGIESLEGKGSTFWFELPCAN